MMIRTLLFSLVCLAILLPTGPVHAFDGPTKLPELISVDKKNRLVTFAGVVMAEKWDSQPRRVGMDSDHFDPDHWHLVISSTQANPAVGRIPLISAWATDEAIAEGLAEVGAVGKDFDKRSFAHKNDRSSSYPDLRPEGTPLKLYVSWTNFFGIKRTVAVEDFLTNSKGQALDLVYLGKQHASECVVCLYGCIGSVCANRALTVRDYIDRKVEWRLKKGVLPKDGTQVWITIMIEAKQDQG